LLKLTSENRVIKKFKSFILGYCNCPCRVEIQIRNKQGKLSRFKHGHNAVGEMNRNYGVHKFREESPRWKGGRYINGDGYWCILRPRHKFAMKNGYIKEHRYFMELDLGRYLDPKEVVHHIDGNVKNNDSNNLILFKNNGEHLSKTLVRDMSNRFCLLCKSTTTYFRKDKNEFCWFRYKDGFICRKCYLKNINNVR